MSDIKVVFVDMDNTIAENKTCQNVRFHKGLYLSKRPIRTVIKAIENVYMSIGIKVVIISKAVGGKRGREEKLKWIETYLNLPKNSLCIFLSDKEKSTRKAKIIKEYCSKNRIKTSEALLIDDNKQTLQVCEREGIQVKYPQQVICDYEELIYGKYNIKRRNI